MSKTTYDYSLSPDSPAFRLAFQTPSSAEPWVTVHGGAARAIRDIIEERREQPQQYGEAGDDTLEPAEWIARLAKHLGRAVTLDPAVFRRQLVRVAAICVAAIESFDRRFPE